MYYNDLYYIIVVYILNILAVVNFYVFEIARKLDMDTVDMDRSSGIKIE